MTSIATTNNSSSAAAAAALIPTADSSNPGATQDFQRMLRSHAAQLSIAPAPAAPQQPRAAAQAPKPQEGISDTQREENRLSNMRKESPPTAPKPIKSRPCTTDPIANPDGADAAAADETTQQGDTSSTPATAKPQPANAPVSAADARSAKLAAGKESRKTSDDGTAAPADTTEEDCSAPEMRSTTGDSGAATALDPAAVLAAAQLNDKTAAALQTDGAATGKQRTQGADMTQSTQGRQAAGADAAGQQASTPQSGDAAAADGAASFAGMLGAAGKQAAGAMAASPAPGAVDHGASAQLAALAGLPSAAANSTTGSAAPAAAAAPAPLVLSQPLHDPSFASEMSAKLSVLASQGVQQAQLHLNPADMGPVQVQIVVDGQQAQVSFHAEHAETRAVLERGLPDLAAALRDTGLTLSGGGVFQSASGGSGNNNGSFQQQARDGAASSAAGSGRIQRTTGADEVLSNIGRPTGVRGGPVRGVVDLYA